jgi:hypothetical protein
MVQGMLPGMISILVLLEVSMEVVWLSLPG